jgi:tRNA threonylcarbamoyladenosine biosynthesis protein TsaB
MHVLAVDTSTLVGSVAVLSDGALSAEIHAHVRQRHGEVLLPHVERALELAGIAPKDLDLLAVGLGPGSFTGTRIGVATLKGLALSLGAPLVGVSSLVVLARGLTAGEAVAVTLVDAHKGELYAAAYRVDARGGVRADGAGGPRIITTDVHEIVPPCHAAPDEAVRRVRDAIGDATPIVCGDGLRSHADVVRAHLGAFVEAPRTYDAPRASVLALCALDRFARDGASDLASLEPLYVRPSDATLPKRPLRIE